MWLGLLWTTLAWAGVTARVDRTSATIEDRFVLTVTVDGDVQSKPSLPDLPSFDVYPRGQSTRMSIVNGRQAVALEFTYVLSPRAVGRFEVGPIRAYVGDAVQQSSPFVLQVVGATASPAAERTVFVTATVDTDTPFVGQQVVYVLRFFRRVQITNASLDMPELEGLTVQDLGDQREYKSTIGGQAFDVVEIRKALIPQRAGPLEIAPASLDVEVVTQRSRRGGMFGLLGGFSSESRRVSTGTISLDVRTLPAAPRDYSGLVGQFTLAAEVSKTELAAGASTTLTATVSGSGNVLAIPEPVLGDLSAFKVYDDKPQGSVDNRGLTLKGRKVFRKSLVPLAAGAQQVGPVKLVWFDPEQEAFKTATQGPFTLAVSPAAEGEELNLTEGLLPGTGKVAVRVVGDDIVPIYRHLDALPGLDREVQSGLIALGIAFPPLGFVLLELLRRRQERDASDGGRRRRKGARAAARKRLREASGDPAEVAELHARALRSYIGDKLGREGGALTAKEAGAALTEADVASDLVADVAASLQAAEAVRYGGGTEPADADWLALIDRLDKVMP